MKHNYRPRNDFVVFEIVDKGKVGLVLMPEKSTQGKEMRIRAIGPKVEDLEIDDRVLIIGEPGQDIVVLNTESNMYMTRQGNITLVIEDEEDE